MDIRTDTSQPHHATQHDASKLYVPIAEFQDLQARCDKLEEECRLLKRENLELKKENAALRSENAELRKENAQLKQADQQWQKKVNLLSDEVQQLKELFKLAQAKQFGKSSEIGEAICPEQAPVNVSAYTRSPPNKHRGNKNEDLLKLNIPRYQIICDLIGDELQCKHCHEPLTYMGDDESLQLELLPSLLYLQQTIRRKYSCTQCNAVVMPVKELSPIPKARAGAQLLTEVIISKFQKHLPLYRQSQSFYSMGVRIPDNTLGRWCMQIGEALLPVYESAWEILLQQHYLQIDETPIKILNPHRKGYLWCYYVRFADGKALILYDFHIERSSNIPMQRLGGYDFELMPETPGKVELREKVVYFEVKKSTLKYTILINGKLTYGSLEDIEPVIPLTKSFLESKRKEILHSLAKQGYEQCKGYQGVIQTDGYGGYSPLEKRPDITRIGCVTHARRKFANVLKITKNKTGIAAKAIERLRPLYAIETFAKDKKLSFRNRKRLRMKKSLPILLAFKCWLKTVKPNVPPKSQLGQAIQHFLDQWHRIIQYVHHGIAEIDTNIVENLIRPTAIGKKNFLFVHHEESGAINGILYSLVQSCLLNQIEPRTYIHYLLTKVHEIRRKTVDINSLLPHRIDTEVLKDFAQQQIQNNRNIMSNIRAPPSK